MTNTLIQIADLKEKLTRKEELVTLNLNVWLKEYDPLKEAEDKKTFDDALDGYKTILKKIVKLEAKMKLAGEK